MEAVASAAWLLTGYRIVTAPQIASRAEQDLIVERPACPRIALGER